MHFLLLNDSFTKILARALGLFVAVPIPEPKVTFK